MCAWSKEQYVLLCLDFIKLLLIIKEKTSFPFGVVFKKNTVQGCWWVLSPTVEGNKLQWPRLTTLYQDLWHTNNRNIFLLFVCRKSVRLYQDLWHTNNRNIFLLFVCRKSVRLYQDLWHTNNRNIFLLFVCRKSWYSVVWISLFPSRVGLRTYQHPATKLELDDKNVRTRELFWEADHVL